MSLETPEYKVLDKKDNFEIRLYNSFIVARTEVQTNFEEATTMGFRRIASYIFGGNDKSMQIPMTAPVISTSPSINPDNYEIMFFMPSNHSLRSLPKPDLDLVKLEKVSLGKVAAIKFGGWANKKTCLKYHQELEKQMVKYGIKTDLNYLIAQYNSPWAIPPFRKNEILVRIIN